MPKTIEIRPCRLADLDRILDIERASFGRDAYERNLFAEFFDKCRSLFVVAVRRSKVCGYMITCIRGDRAEVGRGMRGARMT